VRDSPNIHILPHFSCRHCIDLDLNIQPSLTVMAQPLPLRSGLRHIVDYPPIRGLCMRFLRDCVPGAVGVSMRSRPPQLLDILAMRIHFSTTCPFLIPPLPLVLILNPGIHRQREGITPTVSNPPGALCKRGPPSDLQALLNPAYLVTPQPSILATIPPSLHRHWGTIHP
jgi:hypothetical protein